MTVRDSSRNAGVPSAVISGTTNPPAASGWPIELGQQVQSAVQIGDVDLDGHNEIFTASIMDAINPGAAGGGVAYWAHVGGFGFGGCGGFGEVPPLLPPPESSSSPLGGFGGGGGLTFTGWMM